MMIGSARPAPPAQRPCLEIRGCLDNFRFGTWTVHHLLNKRFHSSFCVSQKGIDHKWTFLDSFSSFPAPFCRFLPSSPPPSLHTHTHTHTLLPSLPCLLSSRFSSLKSTIMAFPGSYGAPAAGCYDAAPCAAGPAYDSCAAPCGPVMEHCQPCMPAPVCAPPAPSMVEAWGKPVYKKRGLFGKWKYSGPAFCCSLLFGVCFLFLLCSER